VVIVPRTWINDWIYFEGLVAEDYLLKAIRQALDPEIPKGRVRSD